MHRDPPASASESWDEGMWHPEWRMHFERKALEDRALCPAVSGALTCTVRLYAPWCFLTSKRAVIRPFSTLWVKLQKPVSTLGGTNCSTAKKDSDQSPMNEALLREEG